MCSILVIDDGTKVNRSLSILLKSMGHVVTHYDDVVEGLSIALDGEFNALLVNVNLLKKYKYDLLGAQRWGTGRSIQVMVYRGWLQEDPGHQIRYMKVQTVRFDPGSLSEIVTVLEESPHTDWLAPHQAFKTRLRKVMSA